jgi:hypothetical protein
MSMKLAVIIAATLAIAVPAAADDLDYLRLRLRLLELEQVSTPVQPKPSVICPDCDGEGCDKCGGDGRIEPAAAQQAVWYFVGDSATCHWCVRAKFLHRSPEVQAAARAYKFVEVDRAKVNRREFTKWAAYYGVDRYPTDLIVRPDGTFTKHVGYPGGAPEYAARLRGMSYGTARETVVPDGFVPVGSGGDVVCIDGVCRPVGPVGNADRFRLFNGGACPSCR